MTALTDLAPAVHRTRSELDTRIAQALDALTLEAKVRLLSGATDFSLHAVPEIGLQSIVLSDGPTGVRGEQYAGGAIRCLLPNATLLAQHWSIEVAEEAGELLAEEAMAENTHVVLGPTVNLHRSPLGGRLFESYSEDPLLTGHLAAAYIRGLQGRGIAATPKHFLANESETDRFTLDSVLGEAALREVYLLPFEIAVADANPWTVMAAYNRVNGTPSTEHAELIDGVLKGEWRFDGVVMSDWHAATSTAATVNAGLDLVMPGRGTPWADALVAAVRSGQVEEAVVDDSVARLLRLAARVGALGPARTWPIALPAPDSPARRTVLRDLAAGGMTVLANRDETLPLPAGPGAGRVAVIGRHALDTIAQGGGSAVVRPPHVVSIAEGLTAALGAENVTVVDGVEVRETFLAAAPELLHDPVTGRRGIRVTARDASGEVIESRALDVCEVAATDDGWLAGAASIELSGALALDGPARRRVGVRGHGPWQFSAADAYAASGDRATAYHDEQFRVEPYPGPGGGIFRPRSKVTELDLEPGAVITAVTPGQPGTRILGLVVAPARRDDAAAIREAQDAARGAEVAVVVVGLTQEQETEGKDKTTLALPGSQDALVSAVADVARRTVVVVNAATPVLMPWRHQVDAILLAGLPGQEAGDAVAAALTGRVEPAGRLVTTFPASDCAGPAWSTRPVDGRLKYAEGTAVGHRGWYESGQEPLFCFGHGLGYATWRYGTAAVEATGDALQTVSVEVTNIGRRTSRETVQVYLRPDDPTQPVRLIGWAGATVDPGGTVTVDVECDARVQRSWDPGWHEWTPLTGGTVLVARGLGDVRLSFPWRPATPASGAAWARGAGQ